MPNSNELDSTPLMPYRDESYLQELGVDSLCGVLQARREAERDAETSEPEPESPGE